MAVGSLFSQSEVNRIKADSSDRGDEDEGIWRTGVTMDYAVGRRFDFLASLGLSRLGQNTMFGAFLPARDEAPEGMAQLGLLFRF